MSLARTNRHVEHACDTLWLSHQWRRWRPCDARVLCLLTPWWAVLSSHHPFMTDTSYPDTVSVALSLSNLHNLFHHSLPNFPGYAFSWRYPGKPKASCRWQIFFIIRCTPASLNASSSLLFFSQHHYELPIFTARQQLRALYYLW